MMGRIAKKMWVKIIIGVIFTTAIYLLISHMMRASEKAPNLVIKFDYEPGKRTYLSDMDDFHAPPEEGSDILGIHFEDIDSQKKLLKDGFTQFTLLNGLAFPLFKTQDGNFVWPYVYAGPNNNPKPGTLEYELTYLGKRDEKDDRYLEYGRRAYPNGDGYYRIKDPEKSKDYTLILVFIPNKDYNPRYYDTNIHTSEIMEKDFSIKIPPIENLPFVEGKLYDFIKNDDEVRHSLKFRIQSPSE